MTQLVLTSGLRPQPRRGPLDAHRSLRLAAAAVLTSWTAFGTTGVAQEVVRFYACVDTAPAADAPLGLALCDARPTAALTDRSEVDNLQIRDGALVVEVEANGISAIAGLQPGDVIYRVGGVNVSTASSAASELERVGTTADTVVNFLRGGRPYRVKLRRS